MLSYLRYMTLSQSQECVCVCVHTCTSAQSLQQCLTLCDPMDFSPPGSSVHGILQARILEWVAMPSLQGIISTQGSTPGLLSLLHWQAGSLPLGCLPWLGLIPGKFPWLSQKDSTNPGWHGTIPRKSNYQYLFLEQNQQESNKHPQPTQFFWQRNMVNK